MSGNDEPDETRQVNVTPATVKEELEEEEEKKGREGEEVGRGR